MQAVIGYCVIGVIAGAVLRYKKGGGGGGSGARTQDCFGQFSEILFADQIYTCNEY